MPIDDGGPAYPQYENFMHDPNVKGGMSLRDHFAGLAMQGMLGGRAPGASAAAEMTAACAYIVADAMLSARKAQP